MIFKTALLFTPWTSLVSSLLKPPKMFSIGYKPTKPEHRASLGQEVFRMRKYKFLGHKVTFWQVKDIVDEIWSDSNGLNQRIQEILVENKRRLKPKSSKKSSNFPLYVLRCYTVRPDEDHATPHPVILSDCKYLSSKSREVILEHGVLSDIGWGRAFLHLTSTVHRLMDEAVLLSFTHSRVYARKPSEYTGSL